MFDGERTHIHLSLRRHESVVILFDTENGQYAPAPDRTKVELDFVLTNENELTRTYTAIYKKGSNTQNEYFTVVCEEMAECFVNGEFCDVRFWAHEFELGSFLKLGKNEIKLVITDNIANKYSNDKMKEHCR